MKRVSFLSLLILVPLALYAQSVDTNDATAPQVTITALPQVPEPGQSVLLSVEAPSIDLNSSTISWKINGTVLKAGKGVTKISATTGTSGSAFKVDVSIDTGSGVYTSSLTLAPNSVDILLQPLRPLDL